VALCADPPPSSKAKMPSVCSRARECLLARREREVSPLVTQLPWTQHLIILSQAKPLEAREFYLVAAIRARWTKRELERQIQSGAILRGERALKKAHAVAAHPEPAGHVEATRP